jgi:hypothetical protein
MHTDHDYPFDDLQAASQEHAAKAKELILERLRSDLDGLLTFLWDKAEQLEATKRIDPASVEFHAIEILQFARYSAAADVCVRHLDTRSTAFPAVSDEAQVHVRFFPFAVAAAAIGTPALSALTTEILTADPSTTRFQLSCLVVKAFLGEDLALLYVANAAKNDPHRLEQASRFVRMPSDDWEATFCSDYSSH